MAGSVRVDIDLSHKRLLLRWLRPMIVFPIFILVGCGGQVERVCPTPAPQGEVAGGSDPATTRDDHESILKKWESGPHADTYIVSIKGENRTCARCHARTDWRPNNNEQPPGWSPYDLEYEPASEVIPEGSWEHVSCTVCHPTGSQTESGDVAWLEIPPVGVYSSVGLPSGVCIRCHSETGVLGHLPVQIELSHAELTCLSCHDPHDGAASCTSSGCHPALQTECEPIVTHDKPHSEVTCEACHAQGRFEIKWDEEKGAWQTFIALDRGGEERWEPYVSHALGLKVDCERCHTPGELPWVDGR